MPSESLKALIRGFMSAPPPLPRFSSVHFHSDRVRVTKASVGLTQGVQASRGPFHEAPTGTSHNFLALERGKWGGG